jgi:hypothetical protein
MDLPNERRADGTIKRQKACLVARGFTQTQGLDYMETFSPIVRMSTFRIFLTLVTSKGWNLQQLDVNTTFIHGKLKEEVYMKVPQGLAVEDPSIVCKLKKSLYGLKQASREWNHRLKSFLIQLGFKYDLLLVGDDHDEIKDIKMQLDKEFCIKDLGNAKYFLGMELERTSKGILQNQRKYTMDIIKDARLIDAKPCNTPINNKVKYCKDMGKLLTDPERYRRVLSRILYLTHSHPDICYVVNHLS